MQAYFQGHATKECCRIVFDHGLWPAAKAIWSGGALGGASSSDVIRKEDARWVDGKLTADGQQPLSLQTLAKKMHDMGGVNSAMVHTFNRWRWATADFDIGGKLDNYAIDALAVQYGDGADSKKKRAMTSEGWHLLDRKNMSYPDTVRNNAFVTYYSPAAIIVDVAVDKKTHQVEVLRTSSWLECGRPIVEDLVLGQMEGGLAMGIGHALLEELPSGAAGPGDGSWNITGYKVPFAKDVGVWQQEHHILPPLSDTDPNKGCAEVVCIPVIAAIQEGIYQATGARINSTPMTAEKIKRALS
jgi:CO/xanthine dehydrogenase Mo-binding subunit